MEVAKIFVASTSGIARNRKRIPAGKTVSGLTVSVEFTDPVWEDMIKTVVFRGTDSRIAEFDGKTAVIPWEVLTEPGVRIWFGIFGHNPDTGMQLPLIEVDIGVTERATDPLADPGTEPTLPIWAQLQQEVDQLKESTEAGLGITGAKVGQTVEIIEVDENGVPIKWKSVDFPDSGGNVDLTGYATEQWVQEGYQPKGEYLTEVPEGYAKTDDIPVVPTQVSAFTNDAGYLTQHQDISGKLDASELPSAINTALSQAKGSGEFDGKSAYEYAKDGGYTGTEYEFARKIAQEIPDKLPNPNALTINGQTYDGSEPLEVNVSGGDAETETVLSDNLLNKSLLTSGQCFYYGSSGYQLVSQAHGYYGFIPLRGAGIYRTKFQASMHSSTGTRIALCDDNNAFVVNATGTLGEAKEDNNWVDFEFVVTQEHIGSGVTKVAFDVYSLFLEQTMIVKDREYPSEYIPYGYIEVATDSGKKQNNILCEKTAVFLGDSICAGTTVGADSEYYGYGWAGLIGEANRMNWTNYGKNGGTITHRGSDGTCIAKIADRAISEHPTADYIIFEGGCNDADQMRDAGLGVISSDYATFDTTTFSGALEALILKLVTAYPSAKIGYVIPQKMYNGYADFTAQNHIHRLYFDRATEICKKWGIPVVDIWNGSMLNPKLSTASIYYSDGIQHLTEAGYLAVTPMIEAWMRNMYVSGSVGGGIAVTGATVGQTVKISAVDENGVPTAWEPTDFPSDERINDLINTALGVIENGTY